MEYSEQNNWKTVWNNRKLPKSDAVSVLERLIEMDGFDTPLGLMNESDWRDYISKFSTRANITKLESLFEVGCGSGAFLYPFYEMGNQIGGIDFSEELIRVAKTHLIDAHERIEVMEALQMPESPSVDVTVANHVVHYFPDLIYAEKVINKMCVKASKTVCITGVPNLGFKTESESFRRGMLNEEEYGKKYAGLSILYFGKKWFKSIADKHGYSCIFFEHTMPGFVQNKFRFDCIMHKRVMH